MSQRYKTDMVLSSSLEEWTQSTAGWIQNTIQESIERTGRCTIALSGGRTPRAVYKQLAKEPFASGIQWKQVFTFWGDERAVGPDHPDNNYNMARETLLTHVSIPESNVFRIRGELPPEMAAGEYQQLLTRFFGQTGADAPVFDLVLLGLNVDGHIASLFPYTDLLTSSDSSWVASTYVPRLNSWRITLTPRTLNHARRIAFLVFGEKKAEIVQQVFEGPEEPVRYPARLIHPENGQVTWLMDTAAASRLTIPQSGE